MVKKIKGLLVDLGIMYCFSWVLCIVSHVHISEFVCYFKNHSFSDGALEELLQAMYAMMHIRNSFPLFSFGNETHNDALSNLKRHLFFLIYILSPDNKILNCIAVALCSIKLTFVFMNVIMLYTHRAYSQVCFTH